MQQRGVAFEREIGVVGGDGFAGDFGDGFGIDGGFIFIRGRGFVGAGDGFGRGFIRGCGAGFGVVDGFVFGRGRGVEAPARDLLRDFLRVLARSAAPVRVLARFLTAARRDPAGAPLSARSPSPESPESPGSPASPAAAAISSIRQAAPAALSAPQIFSACAREYGFANFTGWPRSNRSIRAGVE